MSAVLTLQSVKCLKVAQCLNFPLHRVLKQTEWKCLLLTSDSNLTGETKDTFLFPKQFPLDIKVYNISHLIMNNITLIFFWAKFPHYNALISSESILSGPNSERNFRSATAEADSGATYRQKERNVKVKFPQRPQVSAKSEGFRTMLLHEPPFCREGASFGVEYSNRSIPEPWPMNCHHPVGLHATRPSATSYIHRCLVRGKDGPVKCTLWPIFRDRQPVRTNTSVASLISTKCFVWEKKKNM